MGKRYYEGSLLDGRKAIREAVTTILEEAVENEKIDVDNVHRGRRIKRAEIKPPMLWVLEIPYNVETVGHNAEIHPVRYGFVSLVRGSVEDANDKASKVLDETYNILDNNRTLNNTCHYAQPDRVDMTGEYERSKQTAWSSMEWVFTLRRRTQS